MNFIQRNSFMNVMKKTYVLMLSQSFPTKHPRSGNPTGFREKFLSGENDTPSGPTFRFGQNAYTRCSKVKRLSPSVSGKAARISAGK